MYVEGYSIFHITIMPSKSHINDQLIVMTISLVIDTHLHIIRIKIVDNQRDWLSPYDHKNIMKIKIQLIM